MRVFSLLFFIVLSLTLEASWVDRLQKKIEDKERPHWMMEQIKNDLAPFVRTKISKKRLDEIQRLSDHLARVQIVKGAIYINGKIWPDHTISRALQTIASCAPLPDVDFIYAFNDSFYHVAALVGCKGPLFSFTKRATDDGIILMPDETTLKGFASYLADVRHGAALYPWEEKENKAFWRGANSGFLPESLEFMNTKNYFLYPRCRLVQLSLDYPESVDARFNWLPHVNSETRELLVKKGYTAPGVPVFEHLKYKYQILVDGYTCAFHRAWWQLFSNCVIFKQDSPDYMWYYADLKPYVHYIPVANDFSDLIEKIEWAKGHDEELKTICANANAFAESRLHDEDVYLYLYLLLTEYAKLQAA